MQHKDLRALVARRDLTPAEAYQLASPAQRRLWFGDEPPVKAAAGAYDLPPAAPAGLPPHLEQAVQDHQTSHYADPICPRCRMERKDGNARGGRCPHRPGPAALAEQRRWQRHAAAVRFVQAEAAGYLADLAPVYAVGEAEQRAAHLGPPPVVDRVTFLP